MKETWENVRAVEDITIDIASEQDDIAGDSIDTSEIGASLSKLEFASFELKRSMCIMEEMLGLIYRHLDYYRGIHRSLAQKQQQERDHIGSSASRIDQSKRKRNYENAHEALQLTIGRVLGE